MNSNCFLLTFLLFATTLGAQEKADAPASDYTLQPSDLIKVQVFKEEELERDIRVSQEYTITLPLIGKVDLRSKSIRQAEELIRELYDKDYLVNPQVNIVVVEYSKRTVNVIGSVNTPGAVPFPPEQGLTVLDAISRAGGFSRYANRTKISLTRTAGDGKKNTYLINADELISARASIEWRLLPGDSINVPERTL